MMTTEEDTQTAVLEKTKELCQTIIEQPEFAAIRQRIDTFMADESAKAQFQQLNEKGEHLHHKQSQGVQLSEQEVAEFEREREALLNNEVARGFLDAQNEIRQVQDSVGKYVSKTFELGRLPAEEDFEGCGHGCGCHH